MGRRWARLDEPVDVGGGGCLSGQAGVKGIGRRQQAGPAGLPQRPSHQPLSGGAGSQRLCGPGDGFILGLAGVVVVDEIGHAAKHLGKWRDVVGQRAPPSAMGWVGTGSCYRATRVRSTSGRWLVAGRLLGARGRPSSPMVWVGTRATPKAAGLQRMLWPGRPRMGGPSVGHGYRNDKGQGIVTPPYRPPMLHAIRTGEGP